MGSVKQPTLYLFIGYPGAGKTTIAKLIQGATGGVHLWADHERRQMFEQPDHSAAESKQLYDHLNTRADELLSAGKTVIYDTNFNFYHDREHLRAIAAKHDAEAVVIWVTTPLELARSRAVDNSEGRDTRLYGNMPLGDFERIASRLETPGKDEKIIKIDGTKLDSQELMRQLGL